MTPTPAASARARKTGRRPGDSGSRDAILAAARAQFGAEGFRHTTVRGVAAAAGVDPALVMHYFGSKQGLFTAALALPADFPERVLGSLAQTGGNAAERLVRTYLTMWESPETAAPLLAMYRSASTNEQAARMLREFLEARVIGQIAALGTVSRETLVLVASQLVGAAATRHIFRIEPIASLELERLIARLTVSVQALLESEPS